MLDKNELEREITPKSSKLYLSLNWRATSDGRFHVLRKVKHPSNHQKKEEGNLGKEEGNLAFII